MTKQHFIRAAEIVKSIRDGNWTNEPPSWSDSDRYSLSIHDDCHAPYDVAVSYTRAVQTAEAFLLFFKEYNPRFDERRFLSACGLVEQPAKKGR
jgi:hypothetical protein